MNVIEDMKNYKDELENKANDYLQKGKESLFKINFNSL